jgi:tetratricopeptide (TPR) repeat protein
VSELTSVHCDDFTILRYIAGELSPAERRTVEAHLAGCPACADVGREVARLDEELRNLENEDGRQPPNFSGSLPVGDAFRVRPPLVERRLPAGRSMPLANAALEAADRAAKSSEEILEAAGRPEALAGRLEELRFSDVSHRFALLYALQEAGLQIAQSPPRAARLAQETLSRLEREPLTAEPDDAERIVPGLLLRGQAHLLAGQAGIWTREFERAGSHLELAYRSFARAGDEINLASVEQVESQRRSFLGRGAEALALARRAERTFEALGLDDLSARARAAQGIALFALGRFDEAAAAYRRALPVFERRELWSNYVGALNNLGATLVAAGRLDEARREFARALRRASRDRDRSFLAYIRHGLADTLFAAERYREAAIALHQAARLYADCGLVASALLASLHEIESWGRDGDMERAEHRWELLTERIGHYRALDSSITAEIEESLRERPDLEKVVHLRREADRILRDRLSSVPA